MSNDRPYYPPPPPPESGPGERWAPPPGPPPPPGRQTVGSRPVATAAGRPSAYWWLTVLSALFSLVGLVGVYFSWQVGKKWEAGDVEGAARASKLALWVGVGCLLLGLLVLGS